MADHRLAHPAPVDGCFGCKVLSIGVDGKHLTCTTTDELGNRTREHRTGRVDVNIRAPRVAVVASTTEKRST